MRRDRIDELREVVEEILQLFRIAPVVGGHIYAKTNVIMPPASFKRSVAVLQEHALKAISC
eukprot:8199006-Pyramimonas_sp.AAC.1